MTIWSTTNIISVMVILPVVFPKADLADFVTSAPMKRLESATWATVRLFRFVRFGNILKHTRILLLFFVLSAGWFVVNFFSLGL